MIFEFLNLTGYSNPNQLRLRYFYDPVSMSYRRSLRDLMGVFLLMDKQTQERHTQSLVIKETRNKSKSQESFN